MADVERGEFGSTRGAWVKPELVYDGELADFVQGSQKPSDLVGEPGDPGHRPASG
jgi:hypothetical protein